MKQECAHRPKITGLYLVPKPEPLTDEQKETLLNLRRIWRALRRELGPKEALCEDFAQIAYKVLSRKGLEPSARFIQCEILNY